MTGGEERSMIKPAGTFMSSTKTSTEVEHRHEARGNDALVHSARVCVSGRNAEECQGMYAR